MMDLQITKNQLQIHQQVFFSEIKRSDLFYIKFFKIFYKTFCILFFLINFMQKPNH